MNHSYVKRSLNLASVLKSKSVFLLGPRQTGKSAYIREELSGVLALSWNLLDQKILFRLLADPTLLRQEILARDISDSIVCIDEIQKCPALLDEIQLLIEERNIHFLLTGSSARSLKKAGTNLLGGRARSRGIHPFVYPEIKDLDFSLEHILLTGLIPPHYLSDSPEEDLSSYVNLYLKEEIADEGLSRNLAAFSRFLQTAALMNTRMINYNNIANDAQVPRQTVMHWFDVLRDTLLGFDLPAYKETIKRKSICTSKFYFFDIGVVRKLRNLPAISVESADFGEFFEHYIFMEIKGFIDYTMPETTLEYWRSTSGFEVDFIVGSKIGIEVKSCKIAGTKHLSGLKALGEENLMKKLILVCQEDRPRMIDGILILPWKEFLEQLWSKKIL